MDFFEASIIAAIGLIVSADPALLQIVATSLRISLVAVAVAGLVAVPLGIVIGIIPFPGRDLLRQILATLMAMPTVVIGLLLYGLLSRQGPLGDLGWLYTPTAVIVGECVLILPLLLHLVSSAVLGADPRLLPTLESLGATFRHKLWYVLLETRIGVTAAVVAAFGRAIGEVGVAMMLGGNIAGYTRTMTTAIALETSKGAFELGLALGLILLLVAFLVNAMLVWLQNRP
ncbi:MAG TPA: ABC transporter permease subunit [Methylothermaceae bacterium]|nr:ABC transporter permease subunit [Methylothermaceae bacterium]